MTDTRTITYGETTLTRIAGAGERRRHQWSGPRWRCDTCGREGYGDDLIPGPWSASCARGHYQCPWCHTWLAVIMDGSPRVHKGCRLRPRGVSDDWDAAKDGLVRVRRKVAEGVADEGPV